MACTRSALEMLRKDFYGQPGFAPARLAHAAHGDRGHVHFTTRA